MNDASEARMAALLTRIETMTTSDLQLICGELSRQELRTARALRDWVAREMRAADDGADKLKNPLTPNRESVC